MLKICQRNLEACKKIRIESHEIETGFETIMTTLKESISSHKIQDFIFYSRLSIKTVKQNETAERVMTAVCDSRQMQAAGITMQDIQEAITNCSYVKPLGMEMVSDFDGKKKLMRINMAADGDRSLNLSKTKIRTANGQLVSIDSFVKIADDDEEPVNMERINGLKTVFVDITAEHNANQVIIGEKVKKMMKAIEKSLPHTFEVHLENDSSSQLSHDLQINYTRSALTVLILILFTFISTRNKKLAIVVLTSLIISLCINLLCTNWNIYRLNVWNFIFRFFIMLKPTCKYYNFSFSWEKRIMKRCISVSIK